LASNTRISLLIVLVLFLIVATSLAANVSNLQKQNASITPTEIETASLNFTQPFIVENPQNEGPTTGASGQWYLVAIVVTLAALIAYTYYRQRKRKWEYQPSTLAQILAMLIILAFLYLIYEASVLGIGSFLTSEGGAINAYFFIYVLIACSAVAIFLAFRRYDLFSSFRKFSGRPGVNTPAEQASIAQKNVEELKNILNSAASSLYQGKDYRSVIIGCYKAVILLLEKNRMPQKASFTAREFESEVSSRLGVSAFGHLHDLTGVFERARYSAEPISSIEASEAQETLKQMSSELSIENPALNIKHQQED
jgi:hypothetical protein